MKRHGKKVLGTRNRGRTAIYSQRQINWLERNRVPYTRVTKKGKRVRRNVD